MHDGKMLVAVEKEMALLQPDPYILFPTRLSSQNPEISTLTTFFTRAVDTNLTKP